MPAIQKPLGSAPRRKGPGVWITRKGKSLNPAQATVWEKYYRTGRTDGHGHMLTPSVVQIPPTTAKPPKKQVPEFFGPKAKARSRGREDPFSTIGHAAGAIEKVASSAIEKKFEPRQWGHGKQVKTGGVPTVGVSPRTIRTGAKVARTVSETALGPNITNALTSGKVNPFWLGLEGAAILPAGRGFRLGKDVEKGIRAARAAEHESSVVRAANEARQALHGKQPLPPASPPEVGAHIAKEVAGPGSAAWKATELARTEERKIRLAKAEAARVASGGGEAGHYAYIKELAGELPIVQFNRLSHLDGKSMDKLTDYIYASNDLTQYEKPSLLHALQRLRAGEPPRPFEQALIKRIFGHDAMVESLTPEKVDYNALHLIEDVWNAPRAIMSSFDVSAVLRQALLAVIHKPGMAAKNFTPMMKALFSEKNFIHTDRMIREDVDFHRAQRAGVPFTDVGHDLPISGHEEMYQSNLAEKITGIGALWGKPGTVSFVRASNRAYTTFLNLMRLHLFKDLTKLAEESGVQLDAVVARRFVGRKMGLRQDMTEEQAIGRLVGTLTGRGELPWKLENPEVATLLNTFLFAPRFLASRVQMLNPLYYASLSPFARKEALKAMGKTVSVGIGVLALAKMSGAKVSLDPTNSDFGRVRFGNKRYDMWGGFQPIARLMGQLYMGEITSSTTGKKYHLSGGYGGKSRLTIIGRFFRSKEQPSASFIHDLFSGTDFAGKPFRWKVAAWDRIRPLIAQDMTAIYSQSHSPWQTGVSFGLGALGVGVQSYGNPDPKGSGGADPFANLGESGADPFANLGAP